MSECFPMLDPNVPEFGSRYPESGCYRIGCSVHGGPPCTICGKPAAEHGSYPTCASHPYSPDGKCGHIGTFADGRFIGAPCAGTECNNGCIRATSDTKQRLPEARAVVIEHRRGSISLVQRYLRIGYKAASELLEMLEVDGVVGPVGSDGDYGRKVLVPRENTPMALSSKEKQEAFRARKAESGLTEVRGIFLRPELHQALKDYAAKLAKRVPTRKRTDGQENP